MVVVLHFISSSFLSFPDPLDKFISLHLNHNPPFDGFTIIFLGTDWKAFAIPPTPVFTTTTYYCKLRLLVS